MQGYRTDMEDAHHVTLSLKSHPNLTYIGVFDGHNGTAAAEWMAENMQLRLSELTDPTNHKELAAAVEKADADFMADASVRVHGTTACLALISTSPSDPSQRKLTCASVGDSRCLVIDAEGKVKFTTVDHKPETDSEGDRIRSAGGFVSNGRVDGDLAMSRSIGDHTYKTSPNLGPLDQKVIPTPDCADVTLEPTDMVLVCCDGLVERLTNEQVAQFVHEQVTAQQKSGDVDPAMVVAALLDHSLLKGSKDNMSAALLLPMEGSNYGRADEYRVGPFSEWSNDRSFVEAFFTDAKKHGYNQEQVMALVQQSKEQQQSTASAIAEKKNAILL